MRVFLGEASLFLRRILYTIEHTAYVDQKKPTNNPFMRIVPNFSCGFSVFGLHQERFKHSILPLTTDYVEINSEFVPNNRSGELTYDSICR